MKMKKSILSCLLALSCISASAQEEQFKTENVFTPHWYGQVQLGGQHTLGEIKFSKLNSFNLQLSGGRQFTPVIGARLSVNGWTSKAGSEIHQYETLNGVTTTTANVYKWKWNYLAPTVDATFDMSNLLCGYNPNRRFSVGLFAGIGLNIAWGNKEAVAQDAAIKALYPNGTPEEDRISPMEFLWDGTKVLFLAQAGITADYRINDALSVGIEISANTLSDKYNTKNSHNWDWYFNALVGVKYNFGATHTTRKVPVPGPEIRYVEKIVEKIVEVPAPAPVVEEKVEPLRRDIFFKINSYVISKEEEAKVKEIADYLNKYPKATVVLTGYADAKTGTPAINKRISARRADAVGKMLKEKFQIPANRITYDSEGSTIQPYPENDKNRVTICIASE